MLKGIKNIIFDLGGVIINIDYPSTTKAFGNLFGQEFYAFYSQKSQISAFDDLEIGKIDGSKFAEQLNKQFGTNHPKEKIIEAWNTMLLDIPKERIDLLKKLKEKYRLFLLSNTNAVHKNEFDKTVKKVCGLDSLDSLFEKPYYSHLVGDRKPNISIFERVLSENGLKAEETLFVEDSIQHIEAAKSIGIKTLFLKPPLQIITELV